MNGGLDDEMPRTLGLSKPRQKHSNIGSIGACSWPVGLWRLT